MGRGDSGVSGGVGAGIGDRTAPSTGAGLKVLVVDDEPLIGTTLRILLDAHDVTVLTSGRAARDLLAEGAVFDVVLCDLMLDDLSGMALSAWIDTERPELSERVAFMTGGAFTEQASAFLRGVPSDRRLEKPFSSQELHALLDRFA